MCESNAHMPTTDAPARRLFLRATGASAFVAAASGALGGNVAAAADVAALPKPQNARSPDEAVKLLMDGNARYVAGVTRRHDFAHEREALGMGQNPYAAVLGCADSRIAPEYAFDSARGDLFAVRVAGNFVNDDVLGSLEYAVAVLQVPVIVVLGHDKCGAVGAAVKVETKGATYPGKIQTLARAMLPAVRKARNDGGDLLSASIAQNVKDSMENLSARSKIIRNAEKGGKLKIVGGVYRLLSGKIDLVA
ncbi:MULTISPECIES: carbonic anhydrase [Burkholderia]|nr:MULTISPECIES: carbonic anhydrase [Burkholderia]AXK63778.1 carbonic anhydrase [Burkholderia sp. IDO3]PCD63171.1 carbonic anhydrase [Burkholderia sp. IDO3]VVU51576.1 carbonic anhydrases [Burkholderia anthina]